MPAKRQNSARELRLAAYAFAWLAATSALSAPPTRIAVIVQQRDTALVSLRDTVALALAGNHAVELADGALAARALELDAVTERELCDRAVRRRLGAALKVEALTILRRDDRAERYDMQIVMASSGLQVSRFLYPAGGADTGTVAAEMARDAARAFTKLSLDDTNRTTVCVWRMRNGTRNLDFTTLLEDEAPLRLGALFAAAPTMLVRESDDMDEIVISADANRTVPDPLIDSGVLLDGEVRHREGSVVIGHDDPITLSLCIRCPTRHLLRRVSFTGTLANLDAVLAEAARTTCDILGMDPPGPADAVGQNDSAYLKSLPPEELISQDILAQAPREVTSLVARAGASLTSPPKRDDAIVRARLYARAAEIALQSRDEQALRAIGVPPLFPNIMLLSRHFRQYPEAREALRVGQRLARVVREMYAPELQPLSGVLPRSWHTWAENDLDYMAYAQWRLHDVVHDERLGDFERRSAIFRVLQALDTTVTPLTRPFWLAFFEDLATAKGPEQRFAAVYGQRVVCGPSVAPDGRAEPVAAADPQITELGAAMVPLFQRNMDIMAKNADGHAIHSLWGGLLRRQDFDTQPFVDYLTGLHGERLDRGDIDGFAAIASRPLLQGLPPAYACSVYDRLREFLAQQRTAAENSPDEKTKNQATLTATKTEKLLTELQYEEKSIRASLAYTQRQAAIARGGNADVSILLHRFSPEWMAVERSRTVTGDNAGIMSTLMPRRMLCEGTAAWVLFCGSARRLHEDGIDQYVALARVETEPTRVASIRVGALPADARCTAPAAVGWPWPACRPTPLCRWKDWVCFGYGDDALYLLPASGEGATLDGMTILGPRQGIPAGRICGVAGAGDRLCFATSDRLFFWSESDGCVKAAAPPAMRTDEAGAVAGIIAAIATTPDGRSVAVMVRRGSAFRAPAGTLRIDSLRYNLAEGTWTLVESHAFAEPPFPVKTIEDVPAATGDGMLRLGAFRNVNLFVADARRELTFDDLVAADAASGAFAARPEEGSCRLCGLLDGCDVAPIGQRYLAAVAHAVTNQGDSGETTTWSLQLTSRTNTVALTLPAADMREFSAASALHRAARLLAEQRSRSEDFGRMTAVSAPLSSRAADPDILAAIEAAAPVFQRVEASSVPGRVALTTVRLNERRAGIDGLRIKLPEGPDTQVAWRLALPSDDGLVWSFTAGGGMPPDDCFALDPAQFADPTDGKDTTVFAQQYRGRPRHGGNEYTLWFWMPSNRVVDVTVGALAVPDIAEAATRQARETLGHTNATAGTRLAIALGLRPRK